VKVARSDVTGDQQVTTLEVDRGVRKGVARAADAPDSWDGQVEFKAKRMDAVFVAPGGDFRPYTKLMIDPTDVAFHKDWMKNINRETRDTGASRSPAASRTAVIPLHSSGSGPIPASRVASS